jgi:hypothetical protein
LHRFGGGFAIGNQLSRKVEEFLAPQIARLINRSVRQHVVQKHAFRHGFRPRETLPGLKGEGEVLHQKVTTQSGPISRRHVVDQEKGRTPSGLAVPCGSLGEESFTFQGQGFVQGQQTILTNAPGAISACTSEKVMTRSGSNSSISSRFAVLKPLTRGLGRASAGCLKNVVTATTCSQAPMRHNQSAASAERQMILRLLGIASHELSLTTD